MASISDQIARAKAMPGAPVSPTVLWRGMVKQMYELAGAPPVPGYPAKAVRTLLDGDFGLSPELAESIVMAIMTGKSRGISNASPAPGAYPTGTPVAVSSDYLMAGASPTFALGTDGVVSVPSQNAFKGASARLVRTIDGTAYHVVVADGEDVVRANANRMAREAGQRHGRQIARKLQRGAPPNPETASDPAQFVALMKELRNWSGLSLRQIEEASQRLNGGRDWLPKSSLSDALKRTTLPKAQLLSAFTAAVELPTGERSRWEATRMRLATAAEPNENPATERAVTTDTAVYAALDVAAAGLSAARESSESRRRRLPWSGRKTG